MGGSLGLALAGRAGASVRGYDPDPAARAIAVERGCVEAAEADLESACRGADLIVVCAPVAQLPAAVAATVAAAPPDATVTDIGSTKANVVRSIEGADRIPLRRRPSGVRLRGPRARPRRGPSCSRAPPTS